jgi:hypothetical protein
MATATRKKKADAASVGDVLSGKTAGSVGDVLSMGKTDGDPNQSQLEGMEEERVPEIEAIVSAIVSK